MPTPTRRSFLKETALGGAILGLTPRTHRSLFAAQPPSERVRVGMIGVGNQGGPKNNLKYFLKNVVALCDLDKAYLGEASDFLQKEAGVPATMTDDYRRLLDAKDIDAVVVTVPDQWHAVMTIEACKAGKDVYCEKPLTLMIGEGRPMINAARQFERVVQTGSMQRSGLEFKLAVDLLKNGVLGKVHTVNVTLPSPNWIARATRPVQDSLPPEGFDYNRWLGPAPMRPYNKNHLHYLFRFYWDYSGGQQTNFGAHHLDVAQWGLGMDDSGPTSIEGSAVYNPDGWYETPDTTDIRYTYANGVVMNCKQKMNTKSSDQGTEFVGEKGRLFVFRGGVIANPPELLKGIEIPKIANSQANISHVNNFFECVKSRQTPAADIRIGHRSATVCHLGNIAVRSGKRIQWDPKAETIIGEADDAKWLTKPYRSPWTLG